jgi:hypothetical protein
MWTLLRCLRGWEMQRLREERGYNGVTQSGYGLASYGEAVWWTE